MTKKDWESPRKCTQCGEVKPPSEYYKKLDKYNSYCKACYRKYDRKRYYEQRDKRLEKDKEYYIENKDTYIKRSLESQKRHPAKWKSRQALRNAVAQGKIKRQPCESCGNPDSHGHHEDHSKPLDVKWLCSKCHGLLHRKWSLKEVRGEYVRQ